MLSGEDGGRVKDSSIWETTDPVFMGKDEELQRWLDGREDFFNHVIFKTSGSSGIEKWVALSRSALEWSARTVNEYLKITPEDVLGLVLPTHHVGGFGLFARAHFSGARLTCFEDSWDPGSFADWCERERVTVCSLVPTQVSDLVRMRLVSSPAMRVIVVGGGRLDEELKEEARGLGWPVQPSYGMTETSSQVATGDGLPLMVGWEARVEKGRLALKGGGLLSWVIRRSEDGFEYEDPKDDGWFVTNDLVEINNGRLEILGRADRRVKILGELVNLDELESGWRSLLGTELVLLVKEDERRGVSLWLVVEGESRNLGPLNRATPGLHRLSGWAFMKRLPRSSLGKIDRTSLAEIHVDYDCAEE